MRPRASETAVHHGLGRRTAARAGRQTARRSRSSATATITRSSASTTSRSGRSRRCRPSVDHDTSPTWSPDGKRLAFIRRPGTPFGLQTQAGSGRHRQSAGASGESTRWRGRARRARRRAPARRIVDTRASPARRSAAATRCRSGSRTSRLAFARRRVDRDAGARVLAHAAE